MNLREKTKKNYYEKLKERPKVYTNGNKNQSSKCID